MQLAPYTKLNDTSAHSRFHTKSVSVLYLIEPTSHAPAEKNQSSLRVLAQELDSVLIGVTVSNWDRDLTPWPPTSPMLGRNDFAGLAPKTFSTFEGAGATCRFYLEQGGHFYEQEARLRRGLAWLDSFFVR